MKNIIYLSLMFVALSLFSCEYDNYDAPSLTFSGKLKCEGEDVLFDGASGRGLLKVFQKGFGKVDVGTPVYVNGDGIFNQLLFAGEYWLTPDNHQYPFEFKQFKSLGNGLGYDSIYIDLKSSLNMDIEVVPYYSLRDFDVSLENDQLVMKFKVEKNTATDMPAPAITKVRGYVGTSSIVNSETTCAASADINVSGDAELSIEIPLDTYRASYVNNFRTYAYCRVAVELENIPDYYLFSEVKEITGLPEE